MELTGYLVIDYREVRYRVCAWARSLCAIWLTRHEAALVAGTSLFCRSAAIRV